MQTSVYYYIVSADEFSCFNRKCVLYFLFSFINFVFIFCEIKSQFYAPNFVYDDKSSIWITKTAKEEWMKKRRFPISPLIQMKLILDNLGESFLNLWWPEPVFVIHSTWCVIFLMAGFPIKHTYPATVMYNLDPTFFEFLSNPGPSLVRCYLSPSLRCFEGRFQIS